MIQEFVDRFMANKGRLEQAFKSGHPDNYDDIVKMVVQTVKGEGEYGCMDPQRIHVIDDGDWQGTLLYIIAAEGYQPSDYWYAKITYGSCSYCDTFLRIRADNKIPTKQQVADYMRLALHIVQALKKMGDDENAYFPAC